VYHNTCYIIRPPHDPPPHRRHLRAARLLARGGRARSSITPAANGDLFLVSSEIHDHVVNLRRRKIRSHVRIAGPDGVCPTVGVHVGLNHQRRTRRDEACARPSGDRLGARGFRQLAHLRSGDLCPAHPLHGAEAHLQPGEASLVRDPRDAAGLVLPPAHGTGSPRRAVRRARMADGGADAAERHGHASPIEDTAFLPARSACAALRRLVAFLPGRPRWR